MEEDKRGEIGKDWFVPRNFLKKVKLRLLSRIIES
jgi:hypothetical protein